MSKDLQQPQQSEEVDLGQLFKLIGNAFDRLFKFIGSIINKLFLVFVWFVFFVKKHFVKLVIAGALGSGYGVIVENTSDPVFKSFVTIKQNYNVGEDLYNSINYYNSLVKQNDTVTLGGVLGMSPKDVEFILGFEIESVITENEKIKNYDSYVKDLDSVIASKVTYEQYLNNSKDFNHEYQQLSVLSKRRKGFIAVFDRLIEEVNSNDYFKREQKKDLLELSNKELALKDALKESDSLQFTYRRVLEKSLNDNIKGSEIGITIEGSDHKDKTKEYDLYLNDIELRNKLVELERLKSDKKHIIEIVSSKQDRGAIDNNKEIFGKDISTKLFYGIILVFLTFIVLLGLNFLKFLEKYEEKNV